MLLEVDRLSHISVLLYDSAIFLPSVVKWMKQTHYGMNICIQKLF